MPISRKVLEDSIRLDGIRGIKKALYIVQAIMLVALAFFVIIVTGGAQLKPTFYMPLDSFTAVMVLILLVICLESFFFRIMEIRFARSSSSRHLMAKNSIKTALILLIIGLVATVMLLVPAVQNAIENASVTTIAVSGNEDATFWSRDTLALRHAVELRATAPNPVEVYLVTDEVFVERGGDLSEMFFLRLNKDNYILDGELTVEIPRADHIMFHVILNDLESEGTIATIEIIREMSETFTGVTALLTLAFVVSNAAWMAYLVPIERKFSSGSIYK
jgi:hypothetical protein